MPEAIARRVDPEVVESPRLTRRERRDALLDAAVEIVTSGDVAAVSMEAVAERAGVSRPLVYKHFANRSELLAAVYRRGGGGRPPPLRRGGGGARGARGTSPAPQPRAAATRRRRGARCPPPCARRGEEPWSCPPSTAPATPPGGGRPGREGRESGASPATRPPPPPPRCSPRSSRCSRSGACARRGSTPPCWRMSTWAWCAACSTSCGADERNRQRRAGRIACRP